ncbi:MULTISPECIES: MarR family transcriptional regulator [unclassified Rhizobium]|uniref:MarR family winged helix-turn-helix transcriptional regulator n=1 Tax=unclassified Rhizobium TaxID=2613769 RepID=UPI0006FDEB6B|nr:MULTISPECIES: MarR family transcriptional regulator [unclassified Rhizobium]KQV42786.1 MarR family transcriptional regulator [Rhizobium sp. Root1212]KRD36519.1 MarR family transcriptional regulator [Rhizobium sp. Root268]
MSDFQPIPLDSQLCFSLYGTSIAINRTYKPMLDALGITYPQYLVLSTLWEGDGQTISAIADRLALEPSTITPLVKRLEQAGFVTRLRSTVDERLVGVHLTDKGRGLQAQTGCLTDTLLKRSGMRVEQIIDLNARIQKLREALTAPAKT